VAELGAEDHILTHGLQAIAKQLLTPATAIAWRSVEEVAACLERFLDNPQRFTPVIHTPIGVCQLPGTETDLGNVHASIP
jgi:hypothetical protein